ncbi:hypothetical protein CFAEC_03185 [Corynebacterium faecale]|nr:hypothetical protein CFAEC_03185 [Corynebacterium faecale]
MKPSRHYIGVSHTCHGNNLVSGLYRKQKQLNRATIDITADPLAITYPPCPHRATSIPNNRAAPCPTTQPRTPRMPKNPAPPVSCLAAWITPRADIVLVARPSPGRLQLVRLY